MKKWTRIVVLAALFAAMGAGCVTSLNPGTGETETLLREDVATKIDAVAEAAPGIAALLAIFVPMLYPGIGIVGGAAGMWAKLRPKLKTARTEADMYYAATESLVEAIERFKEKDPVSWATLREKLGDNVGDNTEAVIRAIRGLPLKD